MATFLRTVSKADGSERYYIGGCRVTRGVFYSMGSDKCCFVTRSDDKHTRFYHEARL